MQENSPIVRSTAFDYRSGRGLMQACVVLLLVSLFSDAYAAAPIPAPSSSASSYVLMDHATGKELAARNADERVEPASIPNIMTVYVAGTALRTGWINLTD